MTDRPAPSDPGQLLRRHLFDADLVQLPRPEDPETDPLPAWFKGDVPVLVYPPLQEQVAEGQQSLNLEVTPYHIYYGALRELAETADAARSVHLRRLVQEWHPGAAEEACRLAREQVERGLLLYELAQELLPESEPLASAVGMLEDLVEQLPGREEPAAEPPVEEERETFVQAQQLAFGGEPERAVELLAPLADAHQESWEIWFVLGAAHRRAGDLEEAERCLRRASRFSPEEPLIWMELAAALLDAGEPRAAESAARRALEFDPDNPGFLALLGRALAELGERVAAREALERAHDLVPDDPEIREALEALDRRG